MTRSSAVGLLLSLAIAACTNGAGGDDVGETTTDHPDTATVTTASARTTLATDPPAVTSTTAQNPLEGLDPADPTGLGDTLYPTLGNPGYDVDHYTLDLAFDPETVHLEAIATIEATAAEDLDVLSLDFIGFEVSEVAVDGADAPMSRTAEKLVIAPLARIPAGEGFTVTVTYEGTPQPFTSKAVPIPIGWLTGSTDAHYVVAEPDASRTWFPANDHPLDTAAYTFRITVPEPLLAVANGVPAEPVVSDGEVTYVYEMEQPIATYLATVVIGDYLVVDDPVASDAAGVPIRNVLPPGIGTNPPGVLAEQGEMLAFLESLFGPYPFDLYGIAVVPGFPAALENATLSLFGDSLFDSTILETVLVHELAHQWFGNHVTLADWGDLWLNEGFATYAEWLWIEEREGDAAFEDIVAGNYRAMLPPGLPPPGNPPADDLFNRSVYTTGALTLHALRREVGDEAFFATLRTYVDRYGGDTARTADFISVAEEISGFDLGDLFDAWLYGDTLPEL